MGRIAGRYTTLRDDGLTYTYEASWQPAGDGIIWSATVKRGAEIAGTPSGHIRNTKNIAGIEPAHEVRRCVEDAIENRAGVT